MKIRIMYPGDRVDRMTMPLQAVKANFDVSNKWPSDSEADIILLDNAGSKIIRPNIYKKFSDIPVIYRIRGDMLRAYMEMNQTTIKYRIAKYLISHVDGAISIERQLAKRFEAVTEVSPVGYASIAKKYKFWPDTTHSSKTLRCITLTNCYYFGKIQPLINFAPEINAFLEIYGGVWDIYGRGKYSKYLKDHLSYYDNIRFNGYTEQPKQRLNRHNLMLHFSNFDSLPNAIVEGMASDLPVLTNPYTVFQDFDGPIISDCTTKNIMHKLRIAKDPDWRNDIADKGEYYVKNYHNPEYIGNQYLDFFRRVLDNE